MVAMTTATRGYCACPSKRTFQKSTDPSSFGLYLAEFGFSWLNVLSLQMSEQEKCEQDYLKNLVVNEDAKSAQSFFQMPRDTPDNDTALNGAPFKVSGNYCNPVWDGFLCWPATPSLSLVHLPCPAEKGVDITTGYFHCRVRPYVQNPLRCYKCQRFGHSKAVCRGSQVCSRCASKEQHPKEQSDAKCANYSQPHEANSPHCPAWKQEKQIQIIKATKNVSYADARRLISLTTGPSFATIVKQSTSACTSEKFTQTDSTISGLP
ncbi:unnamed protein product [Larinioides sclopetarius]|uniref:G-protein coupled receptors family 2 profile 1 domain-containing protein n=1 Tax=Larinioides sclopetarius TaxID=280406 RepID=A0AAV2AXA9_9ARAC